MKKINKSQTTKKGPFHIHYVMNEIVNASRMIKETKSIADANIACRICMIGWWKKSLPFRERVDDIREIHRIPVWLDFLPKRFLFGLMKQIEYTLKAAFRFRKERASALHCHSLETLPIGFLYRHLWNKNAKIVYDAHELETEKQNIQNTVKKPLYSRFENYFIHRVDAVIVVSDSIAQWYEKKYSLANVAVIQNVPVVLSSKGTSTTRLRKKIGINKNGILFVYQGRLTKGRNVDILLNVFRKIDKNKHIVFIGYGPLEKRVKKFSDHYSNIHYHPAIPPDELLDYTRSADIGFAILQNTCLNHFYCLPNKFFEYILSGVPVIVSDFPEMGRIVNKYQYGWRITPDEEHIIDLINSITLEELKKKKQIVRNAEENFGWHLEEKKLLRVYRAMIGI